MKNQSADPLILFFPLEIWWEITSYLEPEEIANLKLVCKTFREHLSASALDSIWMPFLNRLHAIDPTISVKVPTGKVQEHFLQVIKTVAQHQHDEIDELFQTYSFTGNEPQEWSIDDDIIKRKLKEIDVVKSSQPTLVNLEKIDYLLNELNAKLIKGVLKNNLSEDHLELTSSVCYLTRIPTQIFLHPSYQSFWEDLIALDCAGQGIRFIGEGIKICASLQHLDISRNQLFALPQALASLEELLSVECANNNLTDLSSIPTSCEMVSTAFNYLWKIPKHLEDKFGEEWARAQLTIQKRKPRKMVIPLFSEECNQIKINDTKYDSSHSMVRNITSYLYGYIPFFITKQKQTQNPNGEPVKSDMDKSAKAFMSFPLDIWREILSHLELEDVANLKRVCKYLNITLSRPELMSIWKIFINRLPVCESAISKGPLQKNFQEVFLQEIKKIIQNQNKEIEYYQSVLSSKMDCTDWVDAELLTNKLQAILATEGAKITLDEIIEKHHLLNDLSEALIANSIKRRSDDDIADKRFSFDCEVSRFPSSIFLDPEFKEFWQTLHVLDCSSENLESLPEEISECKDLVSLVCRNTKLTFLPNSISKLSKLTKLKCDGNNLTSLPNIPDSCMVLTAKFNKLSQIPQKISDRFGDIWVRDTLEYQMSVENMFDKSADGVPSNVTLANNALIPSVFSKFGAYLVEFVPSFLSSHKRQKKDDDAQEEHPRKFKKLGRG